ncbi:Hypothetical predicted protein [Mytilus galloprovincialis]|uniref:Fucolectin tachylectin-4 pentraxin-1 domain-containing protein n=1 Tax=Mytilus galloprovincialis TaxID=29158 RepID=A0A8B6DN10_MYTGA|nr:Hypothetical predicted protein [Mytilus galloprovincialis]
MFLIVISGKEIIVNCSSLARYVRVKKLSADLQFCEMKVNGSNTCPQMFSVQSTTNEPSLEPTTNEPSLEPTTIKISSEPTPVDNSPESTGYDVSEDHVITEVSVVTSQINAVSNTQEMYPDVTTTKTSTGDIAMDETITESTINSQESRYVTCLLCNVALHRPTTSTSMYSYNNAVDGNACNAVDGWNTTNFFSGSCYHSNQDDLHPSITVDLGDIYDIQNVGFALREDNLQFEHYTKLSSFKIYVGNETSNLSEVCAVYPGVPTNDDIGKGILVNCSALARYVMVKKSSADLQFCEMNVIANIPSSFSCPEPPQSWYCRDLCLDVNGSNTCTQNFSIESTTNEVSLKPTTIMDSSETTINIVSSIQTTDDTSPESTFPEISQELVTIEVSAVNTEVSAIPPEVSAITTEMLAVTPDVSTVTIGVSAVTTEASTVTTEASAITTEASTETTKISAVTTEVSAVTTEASAITTEASAETTEASAITTEVSPVTTDVSAVTTEISPVTTEVSPVTTVVSAETTTNEMYLEVTTMVTQTGDVTRGAIITQSTMYAQNTSTRCVCPCLQEKKPIRTNKLC